MAITAELPAELQEIGITRIEVEDVRWDKDYIRLVVGNSLDFYIHQLARINALGLISEIIAKKIKGDFDQAVEAGTTVQIGPKFCYIGFNGPTHEVIIEPENQRVLFKVIEPKFVFRVGGGYGESLLNTHREVATQLVDRFELRQEGLIPDIVFPMEDFSHDMQLQEIKLLSDISPVQH